MSKGFSLARDDNNKTLKALTPKSTERLTGLETTTIVSSTSATGLLRIVATGNINFNITTSTTDSVTTTMAFLPANHVEYFKVDKGRDRFAFLGSTVVYVTSMK